MKQLTHQPCPSCGGKDRFYRIPKPRSGAHPYWKCRKCDYWESETPKENNVMTALPTTDDDINSLADYEHSHGIPSGKLAELGCTWTTFKGYDAIRFPEGTAARYRLFGAKDKWLPEKSGMQPVFYGLDTAIELSSAQSLPLVFVNGHSSVIAAQSHNIPAFTIPGGEGNIASYLQRGLVQELRDKWQGRIVVMLDGDQQGRKSAPNVVNVLKGNGFSAVSVDPGPNSDAADFCRLHNGTSVAELQQLIEKSSSKPKLDQLIPRSYFTEAELGNVKPPTWLVKDYIALGEVTVVYGPSDSGKSTFIMDWVCRICQHYPSMYVAGEDGSGVLVKRGAWIQHYKRGTNGNFNMRNDPLDLFDGKAVDAFIQECFNLNLKVIVIDTLSQCSGAADENSSDMKQVMAALQKIAHSLNVAVIVAHHATKDGSNYRGYSGIKANSYGLISVSKINEVVYLEIERIKNTRPSPKRAFKFVSVDTEYRDDDDAPIAAPVLKPAKDVLPGDGLTPQETELLSTIYEAQQGMERITLSDLKKGTKWADSVFYKVWKRLAVDQLIKKIGGKGIKQIGAVLEVTVDGEALLRKSGALDEERYDDTPSSDVLFEVNTKLLSGATQQPESTYVATKSTVEHPVVTPSVAHQVHAPVEWKSSFDVSGYGVHTEHSDAENGSSSEVHLGTPSTTESTVQATYSCYTLSLDSVAEQVHGASKLTDDDFEVTVNPSNVLEMRVVHKASGVLIDVCDSPHEARILIANIIRELPRYVPKPTEEEQRQVAKVDKRITAKQFDRNMYVAAESLDNPLLKMHLILKLQAAMKEL